MVTPNKEIFFATLNFGTKFLHILSQIYAKRHLSGRLKSKETDFRMPNLIINNLTSTDQTKLHFYSKCLSRL